MTKKCLNTSTSRLNMGKAIGAKIRYKFRDILDIDTITSYFDKYTNRYHSLYL